MRYSRKANIVDWYDQALVNLKKLQGTLLSEDSSKEEKLEMIRMQYNVLSHINLVCDGDAFFVGTPRERGVDDGDIQKN